MRLYSPFPTWWQTSTLFELRSEAGKPGEDVGTDVKVNVWVEDGIYARFKELADRNGLTVTSALKGLIGMFEAEASVLFDK